MKKIIKSATKAGAKKGATKKGATKKTDTGAECKNTGYQPSSYVSCYFR